MEREQFKVLVKAMKAVYAQPTFIPDQDAFNVWFALLGDLRPGNLYKEFVIEDNKADIGKTGRATASFSGDGSRTLKGALAEATPKQKVEWQQLQHPISHTIIQDGRPKAKAEDKLILGERIFLIQGIDDPGSIGVCTIYYVEERMDVK